MYKRNDGTEQMNALQNQFTAYITTSMHRSRLLYLRRKAQIYQQEIAFEEFHLVLPSEIDALEQIEVNQAISNALNTIKEKERKIFLARVIEEKNFAEIAAEVDMGYKGAAAVYYLTIEKLRRMLGDDDNEF